MKGRILFFDVSNPAYFSVIKAVSDRGFSLVMSGCELRDHLQRDGLDVLPFEEFVSPNVQTLMETTTREVMINVVQALQMSDLKQAFSSPIGGFLGHTGQEFFRDLSRLIGSEILVIEAFEALISRLEISLVVLGCDNSPTQRALVKAAESHKIPTLHLAHGIPTKSCSDIAGEMGELYARFLATFGSIHKSRLTENGVSDERMFLTGSPLWDSLYRDDALITKEQACRVLDLHSGHPVVLFCLSATSGASPYFAGTCRSSFELHKAVLHAVTLVGPEVQLVVRPHPNEVGRTAYSAVDLQWLDQAYLEWAEKQLPGKVCIVRNRKAECIRAADVVMSVRSNIMTEAMILQRPVIALPLIAEEDQTLGDEYKGTEHVHENAEIYPVLQMLIENQSRREEIVKRQNAVLPDVNYGHDGKAFERVASLVEQLANPTVSDPAQSLWQNQKPNGLRILLAAHNFPPHGQGGTELYTFDVARALQERGHEVTVLYPVLSSNSKDVGRITKASYEDISVVRMQINQSRGSAVCNEEIKPVIREYLLRHPVDVVHIQHLMGLSLSFVEVLKELNIPIVVTANDFWFFCEQIHLVEPNGMVCAGPETIDKCVRCMASRSGPFAEEQMPSLFHYLADRMYHCKRVIKQVDLLLCPSEFLLKMFRAYGCEAKKMIHAPQGANLFKPIAAPRQSSSPIVFTYLGNIAYRKGLDILIDAINRVEMSNAEFRIYGAVTDSHYFAQTMIKVKKGKKVIFYGPYSPTDLPEILSQTHMAIIPSRGENYPFVIREILHGRVPVIASAVAGIPEIIHNGVNGLLFKGGSVDELTQNIKKVIQEPSLIDKFKESIVSVKSIAQEVIEFEKYYESVISCESQSSQSSETEAGIWALSENDKKAQDSNAQQNKNGHETSVENIFTASIIIPVFNRVDLTKQCLAQLAKVTDGATYEVIIVDNNSTDGTKDFLSTLDGDVQIIRNTENLGFAKACNQGANAAKGKNYVFLNNDTIPQVGWLSALVAEANSCDEIAVVGSKMLYPDGTLQHAGVAFSRDPGTPYHIYRGLPGNRAVGNQRREFQAVTAACMLVKRSWFQSVQGFDECYKNGFEDADLCLKIREQGGKVIYQPKSWLYHLESQSHGRKDHDSFNSSIFLERWRKKFLVDEDYLALQDRIALLVRESDGTATITYKQLRDESEYTKWSKLATLQCLLRQLNVDPVRQHERELLLAEMRQLLRCPEEWPSDMAVAVWCGIICHTLGDNEEGERFFRQALDEGESPNARTMLARLALQGGRLEEAKMHLNVLLKSKPEDAAAWHTQGVYFMQCNQFSEAVEAFGKVLDFKGDRRNAQVGMGMAYVGMSQTKQAWEIFSKAFHENPDDVEAINWVIRTGTELSAWDALAEHLTKFVERNPANGDMRFALASVYYRQGNMSEAQTHLNTLQLLQPDFEGIADLQNALLQNAPHSLSAATHR